MAFQAVFQFGQPFLGRRIGLFFQGFAFDLRLKDLTLDFVDLHRHAIDLDAQLGRALVNQIDGLVRQKSVGNVAVGQGRCRHNGRILDPHPVVHFVLFLQSAQDRDRVLHGWLTHQHRLETALQGGVLFNIFTVFVQGRGPHAAQGSPGQGGLEHVGSIHGPLAGTGADQRVKFVDKKDHFAFRFFHLLKNGFEAIFEFAAVFGAGDQGTHVQGDQTPVFQGFRKHPRQRYAGPDLQRWQFCLRQVHR